MKRSWEFDDDIIERFDEWIARTGMLKNSGAQLALWVVMQLTPDQRQVCLDAMNERQWEGGPSLGSGGDLSRQELKQFVDDVKEAMAKGVERFAAASKPRKSKGAAG